MRFRCFLHAVALAVLVHAALAAVVLGLYLYSLPPEPTIHVGMTREEVREVLGWPFLEHYRSLAPSDRRPRVMYAPERVDWRGYQKMVVVFYGDDDRVAGWKNIDLPPARPAWVNSMLCPIGL